MEIDQESVRKAAVLLGGVEPAGEAGSEFVYEVNKKSSSVPRLARVLEQFIKMAQKVLNVEAASILLFRDNDHELYFEAASGPVGKSLKQVKLNSQYGIAGQVARTGRPLIVNDVTRSENFHKMIDNKTGFVTKSLVCAPLVVHHRVLGVMEVLNKLDTSQFEEKDLDIAVSLATAAAEAIEITRLHQMMLETFKITIARIASANDAKDPSMRGHSPRVAEYALLAGAFFSLTTEEMEILEYAGLLHDIGKIGIDSCILNKPGPLTPPEQDLIYRHPGIGAGLLKEIPFLESTAEIVLCHHERYDGEGYPRGLRGEDIPLEARLIAVANAFDTMTINRPYRPAMSIERSIRELKECSGSQFCPEAVKALISGLHRHMNK